MGYFLERESQKAEAQQQYQHQAPQVIHRQIPTVVYQSAPASTITAMQVRKEKELELAANDQYWANRLKHQEDEFLKNNKIMEKEFSDTVGLKQISINQIKNLNYFFFFRSTK